MKRSIMTLGLCLLVLLPVTGSTFTLAAPDSKADYSIQGPGGRYGIRQWIAAGVDTRGPVHEQKTEACLGRVSFFVPSPTPFFVLGLLVSFSALGAGVLWYRRYSYRNLD
jgi:hypothetical protein